MIRGRLDPASVICSDGWPGYDGLEDVGFDKHIRINKQKTFAKSRAHTNGIEAFWSFTKRRLAKFNGVKVNFHLPLPWAADLLTAAAFLESGELRPIGVQADSEKSNPKRGGTHEMNDDGAAA